MIDAIRARLTYANVVSTLCLFLVLGGGTAVALHGKNSVFSDDIKNQQVKSKDVRNNGLKGVDVRGDSINASDIAGVQALGASNRVVLGLGESRTLVSSGSLSLRARCKDLGGNDTEAQTDVTIGQDETKVAGVDDTYGVNSFLFTSEDPDPGDTPLLTYSSGDTFTLTATAAVAPGSGLMDANWFYAFAPDGGALDGFVAGGANVQQAGVGDGRCVFISRVFG